MGVRQRADPIERVRACDSPDFRHFGRASTMQASETGLRPCFRSRSPLADVVPGAGGVETKTANFAFVSVNRLP